MPNPADYFSQRELEELGLTSDDISHSYQPSRGGVYHCRGDEGSGKSLWEAHFVRDLMDNRGFSPSDGYKINQGEDFSPLPDLFELFTYRYHSLIQGQGVGGRFAVLVEVGVAIYFKAKAHQAQYLFNSCQFVGETGINTDFVFPLFLVQNVDTSQFVFDESLDSCDFHFCSSPYLLIYIKVYTIYTFKSILFTIYFYANLRSHDK